MDKPATQPGQSPRSNSPNSTPPRRGFFAQASAVVVATVVGIVPLVSGLFVYFDPLSKRARAKGGARWVRVAPVAAVPPDGAPRQFPVIFDVLDDAWTRFVNVPVGSVYIEHEPDGALRAFNATCPHAGCLIGYLAAQKRFLCPCHNSAFELDGSRIDPAHCPSPRNMDSLDCEARGKDLWVNFENFQVATPDKKPKA